MDTALGPFLGQALNIALKLSWVLPGVVILEILWPMERPSFQSRLRAAAMWALYIVLGSVILVGCSAVMLVAHVHPLFGKWPPIPAAVCAVVLTDFFSYWGHRAQHRWLWRFHAVHHSLRELSGVNSYHHWTEELVRFSFIVLPVTLLAPAGVREPVIGLLVIFQTYCLHASTRLHFGPLRRVIADNRYHRIHHSLDERHFDKNFSATFPVWDVLFGTAYWPANDEWPAVGVEDVPEPVSASDYLFGPFRRPKEPETAYYAGAVVEK